VVIGAGYGATAARHIRLWAPDTGVTIVERNADLFPPDQQFVLGGNTRTSDITMATWLRATADRAVRDEAAVDPAAQGTSRRRRDAAYDRLIVSPGVDFIYDRYRACRAPTRRAGCSTPGKPGRRPWR
jgi:NADH dehydrogenase FAD-containing subunit